MPEEEIKEVVQGPVPQSKRSPNLATAIIVAGALIALAIMVRGGSSESSDRLSLIPDVSAEDFIRGNPDAPITLIEYADFKCPACAAYQPILKEFVEESDGNVRWVYRDFPIFSEEAAAASICVGRELGTEAYWSYADTLFANQPLLTSAFMKSEAEKLGSTEFDACVVDADVRGGIAADYNRLKYLLGFTHTPTTVIVDQNGRKYSFSGALYKETLADIVETLDK